MTLYTSPHLTFDQQIALMQARGLDCSSCDGEGALSRIGYYRLSTYTHPFRELLPQGAPKESPVHYRTATFRPGYKLTEALALYDFDHDLRTLCAQGLKIIEVGLRVRVGYVLGERDPFGHLNRDSLDEEQCKKPAHDERGDSFDYWSRRYRELQQKAKTDDFFRHYMSKYGGRFPIWVAVEALDFGALNRLYGLMERSDQNDVARHWNVQEGRRLHRWLLTLGNVRNHCAHHARLWNRNITQEIGVFNPAIVKPELAHIASQGHRKKLYLSLAIIAYIAPQIDPRTDWPQALKAKMEQFPRIRGLSPERDMGFPSNWRDEALWQPRPAEDLLSGQKYARGPQPVIFAQSLPTEEAPESR
ncbi:abortive infection bacteriophage resistance protein [Arthrobacter sp. SLBN-112]|uniref:Abi family protein n=1 Tax=Arthrobacter sp. SLBN-112 TaxID=2768452 RepID=UPI0011540958|nr:Abi family protein [Arthrobacter sp. SLBN-112]TQJ40595.1 abortive infection bacteriophage resistance protein [Arthrobacter sp. SLBN-112]